MAIEVDWIRGNCPVQAVGKIDGEPFYFRARDDEWSLSIGSEVKDTGKLSIHGKDVVGNPKWEYVEPFGTSQFDAGWMEEETALLMIKKGAELWRCSLESKKPT
ncbi:hypothetical protein [Roseibium album]|uniref:hypothetical protein n=1 Tax=Roseibium album TaxID=311410 RepID=UPI003BAE4FFA